MTTLLRVVLVRLLCKLRMAKSRTRNAAAPTRKRTIVTILLKARLAMARKSVEVKATITMLMVIQPLRTTEPDLLSRTSSERLEI